MRVAFLTTASLVLGSGCLLTTSFDDLTGSDDAAALDASTGADTGTDPDVADPPAEGGAPVTDSGPGPSDASDASRSGTGSFTEGFEDASAAGCGSAFGYQGSAHTSAPGHTGNRSCLVCRTSAGSGYFTLDGMIIKSPTPGAAYVGEAWVRSAPAVATSPYFALHLRLRDAQGRGIGGTRGPDVSPLEETWKLASVQWTVDGQGADLNLYGEGTGDPGTCFLVDDITIRPVPK